MSDTRPLRAVVVGAGIGGLTSALALALKGHRIDVLEQAASFGEIGAGIQLGPNAYRMLERLGIAPAVHERAVFPDDLMLMDGVSADCIVRIPVGSEFRARFHHPYSVIHRADLHAILLEECRRQDSIRLLPSHKMKRFTQSEAAVHIETEEGRTLECELLVGADGLWSKTRAQIVNDGAPRVSGHIAYRAVLPISEIPAHLRRNAMIVWAGPKNHLVQYPLRGGELFNLVAVFHSGNYVEGWNTVGDPQELYARFEGTCDTVQLLLHKIKEWRMWVLCDREPIRKWSEGRVTLLGDAAHPMLQYLAQGAGMAIEDAVTLADSISQSGGHIERAFTQYETARYLRTGRCQLMARLYGEFYHASGVARELRNEMLVARSRDDWYDGLGWLYAADDATSVPSP